MHVHLAFLTKCHRSVVSVEHIACFEGGFAAVCERFRARLVECNGEDEPMHLLVT